MTDFVNKNFDVIFFISSMLNALAFISIFIWSLHIFAGISLIMKKLDNQKYMPASPKCEHKKVKSNKKVATKKA